MTDRSLFAASSQWIWHPRATAPYNNYVCFRRVIRVTGPVKAAQLNLTADSRYELHVNGEWLGQGPPRSWPKLWPVDGYDLRSLLRPGRNVIAVLVNHVGISTFQYLHADPGLLAQLDYRDAKGAHRVVTDGGWRATVHPGFTACVPRISIQQAWEEQFDARQEERQPSGADWRDAAFDDSSWSPARVMRPAGKPPHESFERRDIPMLTRQPLAPTRVVNYEVVRPAPYSTSITLKDHINDQDSSANAAVSGLLAVTHIHSKAAQTIQIHGPNGGAELKLNGRAVVFGDPAPHAGGALAHGRLKAGWNVLMHRVPWMTHTPVLALNFWTDRPVRFAARPGKVSKTIWRILGPFTPDPNGKPYTVRPWIEATSIHPRATTELCQAIWKRGKATAEELNAPFATDLRSHLAPPVDVFAVCGSDRVIPGAAPKIENPSALLDETAEWTVIHPTPGNGDVRVLLDFGLEIIGHHEFEIDAPAGTVVDGHNFEFIQHDGRVNLAEGMNNSFRYICREGPQRYRTVVRRGFRYSWVTLRGFDRPVRIRFIRTLVSTYPQARQGSFTCSDPMLDRIWEVGANSVKCCAEDTYTDCPTYEQVHWVGDARNEALVDLVANGDARLSRHCWIQAGRSLDRSPLVESNVPSGWQQILPAWTFLWMRWAQEHFLHTGDRRFAAEAMGFLDRNVRGLRKFINDDGLFEIAAWNMFDWAPMDVPEDGVVTHQNCLAVLGLRQAANLATMAGDRRRAGAWNKFADELSGAINRRLWDDEKQAYIDCIRADGNNSPVFSQQTQTAAYVAGVASGKRAVRCREIIGRPPRGFVKAGSPFFMFFVLECLVREGSFAELINTIRSYWGVQIEAGATTFWETYHPNAARLTRSHCHGWSAAPTYFLSQHVLGVQPLEPGYATVRVAPQTGTLTWAQGRAPTPRGAVECYWRRSAKSFAIDVTLPAETPARIEVPMTGKLTVREGKARKLTGGGKTVLMCTGPRVRVEVSVR